MVANYLRENQLMTNEPTPESDTGTFGGAAAELPSVCSARGCGEPAMWALRWNNPKIHTPDRRKTWLACDKHKESLADFLERRAFLREVEPFAG
ncbi:MAG TPA: hypothetical protein VFT31_04845 [Kribbella sp.]|nr:hypothetical protein [Kribbella sp.]